MAERRRPKLIEDQIRERRLLIDDTARAIVARCDALGDVIAVYAYGSYARNTVGPKSDLDLLIVRDTSLRRLDRDLDVRRGLQTQVWADILVVNPLEFRTDLRSNSMGASILQEAVLLKEYDGGEHRRHAG